MNAARGFVKLQRTEASSDLPRDPNAMHLLTVIALRARFTNDSSLEGLQFGQAFIGDYRNYGLTRTQDACARQRLVRWGLARFDPVDAKGTIATLLDSRVFSLTDERSKQGQHKGQVQGHLVSEVNLQNRDSSGGSPTDSEGTARGHLGGSNQNGQKEKKEQKQSPSVGIMARQIYDAYPRKQEPKAALKAITKAISETPAERLLERTRAYAAAVAMWPFEDRKYIPYPASWFNGGGYDGDCQRRVGSRRFLADRKSPFLRSIFFN